MTDAYSAAGVDIDKANETIERYRSILRKQTDARVLQGIGSFSGSFALQGFREPVLVASTDGVGTKVLVAAELGRYSSIGVDLVHHCINDVLCANAEPLFFLDYLAVGKLDPEIAATIVRGVADACSAHAVALLGGETAEMPGVYSPSHFDVAGTIVGALEKSAALDIADVAAGDAIIGLPANGLHTNGYSLARKVLPPQRWSERMPATNGSAAPLTIGDALMAVHPCYLPCVRAVQASGVKVKSMAHITGGGIVDNLPRAFGEHLQARIDRNAQQVPAIIDLIVRSAALPSVEAYRTFNMGIGFCFIVNSADEARALKAATQSLREKPIQGTGATAAVIGHIEPRNGSESRVIIE